ncbi:MAG: phosphate acyltransferase PlsX [Acidimicrobiales bacterium]
MTSPPSPTLPIAVDVMGADKGPLEMVAGARRAAAELGLSLVLVGRPEEMGDTGDLAVLAATEVIEPGEDPAQAVRRKKDASVVRAAEAVRDGRASAMVSAGNTGGAMASALLRMGRLPGVSRPAIAAPLPVPGHGPTILLDCGANAECSAAWLVQFAQMGAAYAVERLALANPRVALLSIGEEPSKGTPMVKETHEMLARPRTLPPEARFIGNVEGRDALGGRADVIVTDGFTGNVLLKSLEGAVRVAIGAVKAAAAAAPRADELAAVLGPVMAPVQAQLDVENYGGAMLLGVDGVCIISHGSSSSRAIFNAVKVAGEMVAAGLLDRLTAAVAAPLAPAGRP